MGIWLAPVGKVHLRCLKILTNKDINPLKGTGESKLTLMADSPDYVRQSKKPGEWIMELAQTVSFLASDRPLFGAMAIVTCVAGSMTAQQTAGLPLTISNAGFAPGGAPAQKLDPQAALAKVQVGFGPGYRAARSERDGLADPAAAPVAAFASPGFANAKAAPAQAIQRFADSGRAVFAPSGKQIDATDALTGAGELAQASEQPVALAQVQAKPAAETVSASPVAIASDLPGKTAFTVAFAEPAPAPATPSLATVESPVTVAAAQSAPAAALPAPMPMPAALASGPSSDAAGQFAPAAATARSASLGARPLLPAIAPARIVAPPVHLLDPARLGHFDLARLRGSARVKGAGFAAQGKSLAPIAISGRIADRVVGADVFHQARISINGYANGEIAVRIGQDMKPSVRLGDLLGLVSNQMDPNTAARFSSAAAAGEFVSFAALRSAGFEVSYDPAADKVSIAVAQ